MDSLIYISLEQIFALLIVNSSGLILLAVIYRLFRFQTLTTTEKLALSLRLTLAGTGIMIILLLDIGICFWISSGDFRTAAIIIPMAICGLPFVFIMFLGILIQLGYREKIQSTMYSIARHEAEKPESKS